MNKSLRTFIKTSGVFFIGNVLSKVIVFLLLPLYTNNISTESYGYYDLSIAYVTVFTSILYFDIWATVLRFMYDTEEPSRKKQVVNTCWSLFFASSFIFCLLGITFSHVFDIKYAVYILCYGLSVNLHNMSSFIARGWKRNMQFAISGIINTSIMVAGNLIMILMLHMEITSLYIAAILGNIAQTAYLAFTSDVLLQVRSFRIDKKLYSQIIRYTMPLCVNSISYWLLTSYNRVVIENTMGLAANGIYAIGNKFGSAIALVTTCFTYAWQDLAFSQGNNKEKNSVFYGKACKYYFMFLAAGFSLMLPCFSVLFPYLIGENYSTAYQTIPLFLLMAILSAFSTFVGNIFYAIKDTNSIFTSMVLSCICNLLLCRGLINQFGINGANLSICLSFVLNIIIRYVLLYKKIDFKISIQAYILPCLFIMASSLVYFTKSPIVNLVYVFLLVLIIVKIYVNYRKTQ